MRRFWDNIASLCYDRKSIYHCRSLIQWRVFLSRRSGLVQFSRCLWRMILFWISIISITRSSVVSCDSIDVPSDDSCSLNLDVMSHRLCAACHLHSSHGMNLNMSGINSNASCGVLVWMMRLIIHRTIGPRFSLRWNCVEIRMRSEFMSIFIDRYILCVITCIKVSRRIVIIMSCRLDLSSSRGVFYFGGMGVTPPNFPSFPQVPIPPYYKYIYIYIYTLYNNT